MDFFYFHFILKTPKGLLAKSADPDQMPHNVESDLGLHYFASCSHFPTKISEHNPTSLELKMDSSNIYGRRVHSVINGLKQYKVILMIDHNLSFHKQ